MDMGVARTLGRHFHWSEAILWKETLGNRKITVSLCGRDLIVDTESVGRYLSTGYTDECKITDNDSDHCEEKRLLSYTTTSPVGYNIQSDRTKGSVQIEPLNDEWKFRSWRGTGIDILWFGNLDHAQAFDTYPTRCSLLNVIRTCCREGCSVR